LGVVGEQDLDASTFAPVAGTAKGLVPDANGVFPHDISVRRVLKTGTTWQWIANSLGDLTKPQNRTGHAGNLTGPIDTTSSPVDTTTSSPDTVPAPTATGPVFALSTKRVVPFLDDSASPTGQLRYREDMVLSNVLSFDVKVWDPQAPVYVVTATDEANDRAPKVLKAGTAIVPGDPGYERMLELAISATRLPDGRGAYVDLFYTYFPNNATLFGTDLAAHLTKTSLPSWPVLSSFASIGAIINKTGTATRLPPVATTDTLCPTTYDTWSMHYEFDQAGTDGVDSNGDGVVDDVSERVTTPPYPVPLRGIQIKMRIYEPDSRTVREVTVVESLLSD
jgi:hypothetical protein